MHASECNIKPPWDGRSPYPLRAAIPTLHRPFPAKLRRMPARPPVRLSVLRDIGWREWDPIGLATPDGGWDGICAADEYDRYLLHLAARLQGGEADDTLVGYLVHIETEHMGLAQNATARARATATVAAMRAYVAGLT